MVEIEPKVIVHRLQVDLDNPLVKQKKKEIHTRKEQGDQHGGVKTSQYRIN